MADDFKRHGEKKLRVLQIIWAPEMGGIENQLLAFLQRYDRHRFIVDVACTGSTTGALRDKYLATATQLIPCQWSRYIIPFVRRLLRLLKHGQYDVVHARMSEISGAAILSAKLADVPVRIASYHHTEIRWQKPCPFNRWAVSILQRITRRWATKILSISESCLDVYYPDWRQQPELFQICYNGVDLKRFSKAVAADEVRRELNLSSGSLVVGHVGSFRKAKNHQAIIDVAERTLKQLDNVYFLLIGDGALRQQIEAEVRKRNLDKQFIFAGNRDDVPRMLMGMDVFIMPSLFEGFGTVAIEAQLSGLAVVASNLPSIREGLCPSMHKFCRDPQDVTGMAEQLILLLKDRHLRSKLGREGRKYVVNQFSIDKTIRQLESVYNSA